MLIGLTFRHLLAVSVLFFFGSLDFRQTCPHEASTMQEITPCMLLDQLQRGLLHLSYMILHFEMDHRLYFSQRDHSGYVDDLIIN